MAHKVNTAKINLVELGQTGLNAFNGQVFEDFLDKLKSFDQARKVWVEMRDNSATVGAVLFAIEMLIRQVKWTTEPGDPSPQGQEKADYLASIMVDMSQTWEETIAEILSMLPFGFSYHEIVFKIRRGPEEKDSKFHSRFTDHLYGIRKLPIRAQDTLDRWEFDDEGGILGMWQNPPPDFNDIFIPIERALLFRPKAHKNNPEGRSVLRNAVRPWFFKKRIQEIEGIGIERDLAGLPIAYAPESWFDPDASAPMKSLLERTIKIVTNIRRDEQEGIVIPSIFDDEGNRIFDIKLLTSGGSRQIDTNPIVIRYKQEIATTMMADFLLLGQQSVGSYALADSKTDIFATAIGAWLETIEQTLNRILVPRLWSANGWPQENLPQFRHGDIETPNLAELGTYISALSGAGMTLFPDDLLENRLRQAANLPAIQE